MITISLNEFLKRTSRYKLHIGINSIKKDMKYNYCSRDAPLHKLKMVPTNLFLIDANSCDISKNLGLDYSAYFITHG
jgi:hypothetical protein